MKHATGLGYGMHCVRRPRMRKKGPTKKCHKCNSKFFTMRYSGPHLGLYCSECEAWLTWVRNSDLDHYTVAMERNNRKIYAYH